jgi:hypothetical protein
MKASGFALAGPLLTFFGFMHGVTASPVERGPESAGEGVPAQA